MSLDLSPSKITLCGRCNLATFTVPAILQTAPVVATQIRTNHIPLESEKHQLMQLQLEAETNLSRYDEELSRLRSLTAELEAQRAKLQQLVDGCKGLRAPIRRLPTELLDDIFSRCDWDSDSSPSPLEYAVGLSPLCLGGVCTRWRTIVLSSSHLWTYISMTLKDPKSNPGQAKGGSCATILRTYLERSGQLPLSIEVCVEGTEIWPSDSEEADLLPDDTVSYYRRHPLLRILTRHAHRWRRAILHLDDEFFGEDEVLADSEVCFPLLEVLQLGQRISTECSLFDICPRLRELELSSGGEAKVPWNQLTHVTNRSTDVEEVFTVLQLCPKLVQLDFVAYDLGSHHPATSSNLHSISIDFSDDWDEADLASFFDALTLQCLKSMKIIATGDETWPHVAFTSFLRRSSCPLSELSLKSGTTELSDRDLVEVLELVPNLTSLYVDNYAVTDALIHSLTYFPSDAGELPLLPRLTSLVLNFPATIDSAVLDMVESRWIGNAEHFGECIGAVAKLECVSTSNFRGTFYYRDHWSIRPTSLAHLRAIRSDPSMINLVPSFQN